MESGRLAWERNAEVIAAQAALDGIYVIRTSVSAETLDASGVVNAYEDLAEVERDFRNLEAIDLACAPSTIASKTESGPTC